MISGNKQFKTKDEHGEINQIQINNKNKFLNQFKNNFKEDSNNNFHSDNFLKHEQPHKELDDLKNVFAFNKYKIKQLLNKNNQEEVNKNLKSNINSLNKILNTLEKICTRTSNNTKIRKTKFEIKIPKHAKSKTYDENEENQLKLDKKSLIKNKISSNNLMTYSLEKMESRLTKDALRKKSSINKVEDQDGKKDPPQQKLKKKLSIVEDFHEKIINYDFKNDEVVVNDMVKNIMKTNDDNLNSITRSKNKGITTKNPFLKSVSSLSISNKFSMNEKGNHG